MEEFDALIGHIVEDQKQQELTESQGNMHQPFASRISKLTGGYRETLLAWCIGRRDNLPGDGPLPDRTCAH